MLTRYSRYKIGNKLMLRMYTDYCFLYPITDYAFLCVSIDNYALTLRKLNFSAMDEIFKLDNISQFNTLRGIETLHPLVSVFDFST